MSFKTGDEVRLKSGGPTMTVEGPAAGGGLLCAWFLNGKVERDAFEEAMLEAADADPPAGGRR